MEKVEPYPKDGVQDVGRLEIGGSSEREEGLQTGIVSSLDYQLAGSAVAQKILTTGITVVLISDFVKR